MIPIFDKRAVMPTAVRALEPGSGLADAYARPLRDLRISVTDRCNFRCTYCMPKEVFGRDYEFLPHRALLSFEEITRLARLFRDQGVTKIRLTGGEPLLRKNIERLIEMLASLGGLELTLTTNGSLLARKAQALADAGLTRVTVSLDSLDERMFQSMNNVDFPVAKVLEGIDAAHAAGFAPIKVNMVVKRGVNDRDILPMARYFKGSGHILRFIEFMDVGATNGWRMDEVLPSAEVVRIINAEMPLEPVDANYAGEVAERWRYRDGSGEIGLISSVTQAFCGQCTRARLSTEGKLYTCLFATAGQDFRDVLRGGASDADIAARIQAIWSVRDDRYSALRAANTDPTDPGDNALNTHGNKARKKVEMSYIGG